MADTKVKFSFEGEPAEYALELDFNELADAEPIVGCNLLLAIRRWPNLSCQEMRGLLYAMSRPAHPKVALADAGALCTHNLRVVMAAIRQVLVAAEWLADAEPVAGQGSGDDGIQAG
jgi:hypothetical protein